MYIWTSISGRREYTRKSAAYTIIPLNVVTVCLWHNSARTWNLPLLGFLPLKVNPFIEARLYLYRTGFALPPSLPQHYPECHRSAPVLIFRVLIILHRATSRHSARFPVLTGLQFDRTLAHMICSACVFKKGGSSRSSSLLGTISCSPSHMTIDSPPSQTSLIRQVSSAGKRCGLCRGYIDMLPGWAAWIWQQVYLNPPPLPPAPLCSHKYGMSQVGSAGHVSVY
jgi:hypothetical protein